MEIRQESEQEYPRPFDSVLDSCYPLIAEGYSSRMKCPRCQFENNSETNFCGKCGMPLLAAHQGLFGPTATMQTPLARLERGTVFAARYEIIEELGKGGMGREIGRASCRE